ncbi:hypothetical protein PHAVU_006G123900 [Phaseolus vulgaris]|uniref:DNA polymerase delta subunit 4 n=1 Tax=Phaseolus vulgaris TaxID=3885 RepID=V7BQU8_PHAVU|nr:hypothetical protein PHAVU_006G123900g [Phaseolus vulgaris]ESW19425.1 hypothetical protein PHAVU_006G123900g [Phaseolus vulgaris]
MKRKSVTNKSSKPRKKSKVVAKPPEEEYSEEEKTVRAFDTNMKYGPCLGITRLQRWERAHKLGLNPPMEIKTLLESHKVEAQSLWHNKLTR